MKSKIFWFILFMLALIIISIIILCITTYFRVNEPILTEYNEIEVEKAMKYHGILYCWLERDGNFYAFRDDYKFDIIKTYKE